MSDSDEPRTRRIANCRCELRPAILPDNSPRLGGQPEDNSPMLGGLHRHVYIWDEYMKRLLELSEPEWLRLWQGTWENTSIGASREQERATFRRWHANNE